MCIPISHYVHRAEQKQGLRPVMMTYEQSALTAQASWYVYSRMHVSKREFESQRFKTMLHRTNKSDGTVCLGVQQLVKWTRAEFGVNLIFIKEIIQEMFELALGNPFAQILHDGGTLANKKKYQVLAIQFISPEFDKNPDEDFMEYMRARRPKLSQQRLNQTVVSRQ